jgi:phage baseplate assembly protein W
MAQYIGFSTINAEKPKTSNTINRIGSNTRSIVFGKKYRMVDEQLVIQDFINALNIPQGQKVGQPGYGTTLWNFVFEPNTPDVQRQLENEIRRVASSDPRLQLNYVNTYAKDNGVLIEIELAVSPFNQPLVLSVFFNQETNTAFTL